MWCSYELTPAETVVVTWEDEPLEAPSLAAVDNRTQSL